MRIFIGLVTPNATLSRHFDAGVIPKEAISRGTFRDKEPLIVLGAFTPDGPPNPDDFERFLIGRTKEADACLLLIDTEWERIAENIRGAALALVFDRKAVNSSYKNFFRMIISKILRAFRAVLAKFESSDDSQLLSLPLRNFHAAELTEIARLCRDECHEGDFVERLQAQLSRLRSRRRPRKQSSFNTKYVVDDQARFFVYGNEKHARFGTGEPHRPSCALTGYFRFGTRIDSARHYNVSETEGDRTRIEGEFDDCHDAKRVVPATTHLNMFSNDFF